MIRNPTMMRRRMAKQALSQQIRNRANQNQDVIVEELDTVDEGAEPVEQPTVEEAKVFMIMKTCVVSLEGCGAKTFYRGDKIDDLSLVNELRRAEVQLRPVA